MEFEDSFLTDELDHEILMQRDAHFGGNFDVMHDYYLGDGLGVNPEIELDRIDYLTAVEKELGQNLSALLLSGPEMEKVGESRTLYKKFKDLYESEEERLPFAKLIGDLILSEEEEPQEEIDAIVSHKEKIVPYLLDVIRSDWAYDSLFPGYGYAPERAILCLGKIGSPQAILPLFETLSRETLFGEGVIFEALRKIGEPAKVFLLKVLEGRPLTQDNILAASVLASFEEEGVGVEAFTMLKDPLVLKNETLSLYLLALCENLRNHPMRDEFLAFAQDPKLPASFSQEAKLMIHAWSKNGHV